VKENARFISFSLLMEQTHERTTQTHYPTNPEQHRRDAKGGSSFFLVWKDDGKNETACSGAGILWRQGVVQVCYDGGGGNADQYGVNKSSEAKQ
jgi:hypothetical protein